MNKQSVYLPVFVLISLLILHFGVAQEDMTQVDNSVFGKPQRPASLFRHDSHNDKAGIDACNVCHHVYRDGKLLEDESSEDRRCSECHGLKDSGKTPSLRKAFHLNCRGCHEKTGKGPVMCGECHSKGKRP